ncbi:hypothetical protein DFH11DRAFT_1733677 [Phellopilus nigrolimitatus]|nr:hypothetical protein DFH11DRAFT_1733677 [Phellopilus nigrolimitatus]
MIAVPAPPRRSLEQDEPKAPPPGAHSLDHTFSCPPQPAPPLYASHAPRKPKGTQGTSSRSRSTRGLEQPPAQRASSMFIVTFDRPPSSSHLIFSESDIKGMTSQTPPSIARARAPADRALDPRRLHLAGGV